MYRCEKTAADAELITMLHSNDADQRCALVFHVVSAGPVEITET